MPLNNVTPEKLVAAIHNPQKAELLGQICQNLGLSSAELSPLKAAMLVALFEGQPDLAKEPAQRELVGKILRSQSLGRAEKATQPAATYREVGAFAQELTQVSKQDLKNLLVDLYSSGKSFEALLDKIIEHRDMWAKGVRRTDALQPELGTPVESVNIIPGNG